MPHPEEKERLNIPSGPPMSINVGNLFTVPVQNVPSYLLKSSKANFF